MKLPFFKKNKGKEELEIESEEIELQDIIAPPSIEIKQNSLKLGERLCKTFFIFSYPRYLSSGWMSPAINLNNPLDIAFHIHPISSSQILRKLRKKLTEVQAELMEREEKGLIRDPTLETAYTDIEQLRDDLQKARERVFRLGLYITIYGDDDKELRSTETRLRSIFEARLIYLRPTILRERQGFTATSPYGIDKLLVHTPMNTEPLSSIFPFVSPDLSGNEGILYGINQHNNSLVLFDRFSLPTGNMTIFAKSGAGKSIVGSEKVLVKNNGKTQLTEIGSLIEKTIKTQGIDFRDEELEGKTFPGIDVWTFDKDLKGKWGEVKVAARKKAPETFYKFKTKSGREITTTGDHNLVVLKNGKVVVAKSSDIQKGEYIPLTKKVSIEEKNCLQSINLLLLLKDKKNIYVKGGEKIIKENYTILKQLEINPKLDKYLYKYKTGTVISIKYFWQIINKLKINLQEEMDSLTLVSHIQGGQMPAILPITDEFLKILGYITSEGTITKKYITISNIDKEVIADIKHSLEKLKVPHFKLEKSINVGSSVFVETIKALGGSGKSHEKTICPFIFNLKREKIAMFLAAYFEGDAGIEKEITAVSKSKQLVSEIAYLFYWFGIVGRITNTKKKPTNSNWKQKQTYWKLNISGQNNLKKYAENINFISESKKKRLAKIINKHGNTNVDIIPEIQNILEEIYELFGAQLHWVSNLSPMKRGIFSPSPEKLKEIIFEIKERIQKFKNSAPAYKVLSGLPSLAEIINLGRTNRELNGKLWQTLGQSWRVVKNEGIRPRMNNAFKMLEVISGKEYQPCEVKKALYNGFQEMDLPVKYYNKSLQPALKTQFQKNTRYDIIQNAAQYIWQNYQDVLTNKIPKVEKKLNQLKILANSELFWDPIAEIKKIENKKEKYVYDLTCENGVFLAGEGGMFVHNSYMVKLEVLRYLMQGVSVIIIDPENEYSFLTDAVGGSYFKISLGSENHLNPFGLPTPQEDEKPEDILRSNAINLVGLLRIMLGGLTPQEDSIIDRAITETYAAKDITPESNPLKWNENIPLMADFESVLSSMEGTGSLVERIRKFSKGSYSQFFNQPTNISMNKQFVVFGIRDMEDELRPMAMFIILRYIWNTVRSSLKKRILLVDEAWWIMQTEDGASFLYGICKRARKYWLGISTITQDVGDFMRSEYGKPIITNSSLQFLMKQSPATIDMVQKTFNLTDEEKYLLLESDVGEGIFIAGQKRVALKVVASYAEDQIITSSPEEVKRIKEAKKQLKNNAAGTGEQSGNRDK